MRTIKKIVLTGIAGLVTTASFGQFTLSGEIRPRAEYRHGYKSVADSNQAAAFSIDQRTRINAEYKVDDYEFYVSLQDIRTWGSNSQLNVTDGFLAVHQAWAKVNFNKNWGLKLGRQEIKYNDHRIFGNVGWAQQARSHDAALLQFKNKKTKVDVAFAFNQNAPALVGTDYTVPKSYRDMQYVWADHTFSEKVKVSLLALNLGQQVYFNNGNGDPTSSMQYTQTLGTHTNLKFGKFKLDFNGFVQTGSPAFYPTKPLIASLIGIDMKYGITKEFSVGLGYERQSGTSQTDTTSAYTDKSRSFSPWFGTNHKFNGYMDYFYVGSGHGNVGLQDIYAKCLYKKDTWSVGLNAHIFMSAEDVMDPIELANTGNIRAMSSMLGTEIDLSIMKKINKSVTLKAGYSHMLASETLATLKGVTYTNGVNAGKGRTDQINNWGYVMVIFKPTFLKTEIKK